MKMIHEFKQCYQNELLLIASQVSVRRIEENTQSRKRSVKFKILEIPAKLKRSRGGKEEGGGERQSYPGVALRA